MDFIIQDDEAALWYWLAEQLVDERQQSSTSWYNKDLVWDEKEFPFTTLSVPWSSVWTPILTIREMYDVTWMIDSPNVVLHSDGKTEFLLPLSIESNCNFNLFYYPLDVSSCTLSFFSLSNKVNEIEFKVSVQNKILNIKREYLVKDVNITSPRNMAQPYFVVKINLENTGVRTLLSVVVPSIALVVADLCGFVVPLRDRLAYMVTLLLAYLVFHSSVVGSLPGSSSCNALLSIYYTGLLVLLFMSTIETILVTKLVVDNLYLWQNWRLRGRKAKVTAKSPDNKSYCAEDAKDPGKGAEYGTNEEPSHRNGTSVALDRLFFFLYIGLLILFHCLIPALWIFWTCESGKPPGEDHLDGIKW
ncbi:hypothetical protein JD844_011618 [Phrynosoma platyrhinos]|uniref:Neurotransmitter-gated ion-channel ligand-binding domain-containing protein n=1 Tax=Phrynosoma platyrhinos TaxID=52577 RepID=A0ABQ7TK26_PHRPL|nr:hypothetical protein JD844_011618 [Phrynosoma platyrhinos]